VELEAELAEPRMVEPRFHDLERGHLLSEEEHALSSRHGRGDEIGDGLALAGPGGTLDREVAPVHNIDQGAELRGIGVGDEQRDAPGDLRVVDIVLLGEERVPWRLGTA
jgi:hypothetical protein